MTPLSFLWYSIIRGVQRPKNEVVVQPLIHPFCAVTFQAREMAGPVLFRLRDQFWVAQLERYILEVFRERRPQQSLNVFDNDSARL